MPTIQSTFGATHARWFEGMVLTQEPANIVTRIADSPRGCPSLTRAVYHREPSAISHQPLMHSRRAARARHGTTVEVVGRRARHAERGGDLREGAVLHGVQPQGGTRSRLDGADEVLAI